ncbi:coproporphyrinogen III oxidase family protein [Candidatus Roizmanbacteria bacterium]|nr:MAG: coproporphyrinogen III oxidase family protein [Candidatus Roizmanbacteria bacterium]
MSIALAEVPSISEYDSRIADIIEGSELGYIYNHPDKRLYEPIPNPDQFVAEAWNGYQGPVGVYVHVPWCTDKPAPATDARRMAEHGVISSGRDHLCSYCNLYTAVGRDVPNWYAASVQQEAAMYKPLLGGNVEAQSLYFGGGSPSILSVEDMSEMIRAIEQTVGPVDFAHERAIEVIPDSVDLAKLQEMRKLFNRISVGVQSFDPQVLRNTGRAYDPGLAQEVIRNAFSAGFEDINGDLIIGLQGSSAETFQQDLETMIGSGVTTITLYPNMIRPGTRAGKMAQHGLISYPTRQEVTEITDRAAERLQQEGYRRLSLTCWSKTKGYQQGEQIYSGIPIIGFGAGARSYGPNAHYALPYSEDVRFINNSIARWKQGIEAGHFPDMHGIVMTDDMKQRSHAILGLMSQEGVKTEFLQNHFSGQLQALMKAGLVTVEDEAVHYTDKGKAHSGALSEIFFSEEDKQILAMKDSVRQH